MPDWIKNHPQYALVDACSRSKSRHEQRWATKVLEQFESQQTQFAGEHDDLCWYFLTFCCGFGYGYRKEQILQGRLTPKIVAEQLGLTEKQPQHKSLHVSMPNQTMAACVDIDAKSRYHPANNDQGIEPVKNALAEIDLIEPLEFQSSHSTGIHLWYPLPTANNSWELAVAMEDACKAKNLEIKGGTLELRPNRRNFDSNYLAIRLPLSGDGNALKIGDVFGQEESSLAIFRHFFNSAASHNRLTPLQREHAIVASSSSITRSKKSSGNKLEFYKCRLVEGFSGPGQTQEISLAALIVARMAEGVGSVQLLRQRLVDLVTTAPGFRQYCDHQQEIETGRYWSEATLKKQLQFSPADYEKSWRKIHNEKRAREAAQKAQKAIFCAVADEATFTTQDAATAALRANYGAPCKSWWRKPANRKYKQMLCCLINKRAVQ